MVLFFQLRRSALRHDPAVVNDRDPLRHTIGLVHVVRGQKHRDAFSFIQAFDVRPHLIAALRIESQRGFVQEENLGRV